METHPLGMADYQLLGDGFGYHSAYGSTNSGSAGQPPGQTTAQTASHQGAQTPIINSGTISGSGSQAYHQLGPHAGPAIRQLGYGPPGDPSKLHDQYSSSYASGAGLSANQSSQLSRGQYNPHDPRYQHNITAYASSLGQSHLGLSQHPNAPPSQTSMSQLSSASYQARSLMGQYGDQRMHAPGLAPRPSGPVHGLPSHYPASYSASPYGHPGHGSGDLWSSQGLQHIQQRPPYYPNAPHPSPQTATHSPGVSMHGPRGQNQFVQSEYGAMHQQRPYYQPTVATGQGPQSSVSGHIPSDGTSMPPYPSSQGPYNTSSSVNQSSSRSSISAGPRQPTQTQFTMGYTAPNSTIQSPAPPGSQQSGPQQGNATVPRYPHQQYSGYASQQAYGETTGQSRLSPYGLQTSGPQGPNSPSYRSPYPGTTTQVSALSPRRPTPTPPAGSPMPPTSHTPDRVTGTSTSSAPQSQGGYTSPGASQLTSPNQGVSPSNSSSGPPQPPPPTNSLQQLEQMVMPHLSASASSSKSNSISSTVSTSNSSSNSYYGMSVQQAQGTATSQVSQPSSQYSHYSPPTSISHQQSSSHNYYPQYQQNSALWQQANQTSVTSASSSSSLPNTHSPLGSVTGASLQQPSASYSSAAQINQQQSGSKQASLQSPQQPNSISGSNVQATSIITNVSNKSTVSNISSSTSGSVNAQQYNLFDNQFNSSTAVNESGYSKSSSSDNSVSSVMSPRQSTMSQQPSQLSSFDISSLAKGSSSFESSVTSQNQKADENQMQHSLNQDHKDSNRENDYQQTQKQKQVESQSQSSNDPPSNFYDVLSPTEGSQISSDVMMTRESQKPEQRQTPVSTNQTQTQSLSSDQQPYLSQPVADQQSFIPQHPTDQSYLPSQPQQPAMYHQQPYPHPHQSQMPPYANSYADSYDLAMAGEPMNSMNTSYGASHESLLYEQNYGQTAAMDSMMGPGGHMGDYGHMGEMSSMPPYDPYDDTFASEPSTKRKGKGRPKKDPTEPKKEKKPRQPRAPKSTRGRGRGARNNTDNRMPPPPPMSHPDFDGGFSMGADSSDLYPPMIAQQQIQQQIQNTAQPLPPPPSQVMQQPPQVLQQPLQPPLQQSLQPLPQPTPQMSQPPPSQQPPQTNDVYHSQSLNQSSMSHTNMSQLQLQGDQNSFDSVSPQSSLQQQQLQQQPPPSQQQQQPPQQPQQQQQQQQMQTQENDINYDTQQSQIQTDSTSTDNLGSVDQMQCDDLFSQSTSSNSLETPLFVIPHEEPSNVLPAQESQSEPTLLNIPPESKSPVPILPEPPTLTPPPQLPNISSPACNDVNVSTFEFCEDQNMLGSPVKKKGKKRKLKESELSDITCDNPEKKAKKPKKRKSKTQTEVAKDDSELKPISEALPDAEQTIIQSQSTEFDDATQEDASQLDFSGGETSAKAKKSRGKEGKSKKPKLKEAKSKVPKKKLPKLALKFGKKKKRKRLGSSDNSDLERTPPPSPDDIDSGILKRRSARNTKRQKYTDDIELELSDDESKLGVKGKDRVGPEGSVLVTNLNEDTMVVDKFLGSRIGVREVEPEGDDNNLEGKPMTIEVEEYYVKYKNLSYLHCDWKTEEELEKGDKRISQKIKRFKQKRDNMNMFDFLDDEPFNPEYCEVDRILDVNEIEDCIEEPPKPETPESTIPVETKVETVEHMDDETIKDEITANSTEAPSVYESESNSDTKIDSTMESVTDSCKESIVESTEAQSSLEIEKSDETICTPLVSDVKDEKTEDTQLDGSVKRKVIRHYLVKWRGLPYEECNWELEDDLDPLKVQHFWKFKNPPPKDKWKPKKRPKAAEWKKLDSSPVYKSENTLREYQLEGVNWLMFCWHNNRNCILADEMGLGKTIQSIAFIQEIVTYGIPGPFLVIAPLSTIGNWQREFETWTDLNVITYHGSSASRNMLQEYEMYYKDDKGERIESVYKFQVMITTFEIVLTDCLELRAISWRCCIIDEAHRLKNRNCKLLEGLRLLDMEHRVLLTGTPLQNNVEELFSLLNFLEPTQFASSEMFLLDFGDLKTEEQVDKLKAILKPMMLRRLKEDVEKSLAPKEETIIEVELTNIQKKYYRAIMERNFQFLTKGGTYANMPNLMNTMMELRKCCIHPFLINGAEEQVMHEYKQQHGETSEAQLQAMIQASGKLVLIDKLLPRLRTDGHRVLVFSQMVRCLDILEDYLVQKRYPYERIDGRVRGNLRQAAIDRFCKPDSDRFVFLLCTRAGGLGINLTAADTVIIFDSDWNPQNDLQAQARCHRIGQSKMVKVYRLICRNTYEREMFDKASLKLGLDKAVLQSINTQKSIADNALSKKEVEDLLRKGAYGAIMDDDNAGDKFCEEDIEQILQRRTHVITIESEEQGSTFSKASFAASDNRSDIEIDDPNFWEKWARKAHLDVDELKGRNELIVQEPRKRTQTKRFGQDDSLLDISDVESSDDDDEVAMRTRGSRGRLKSKKGRKGRGGGYEREKDEDYLEEFGPGNWTRAECYKVEKGLLTFGWGRWEEFLILGNFRRRLSTQDVEDIARVILLFCLQNYKGDEKIKSFIWDLISPAEHGGQKFHKNHSGLSAPVPRGRKNKKIKRSIAEEVISADWARDESYNPDFLLTDEQYRKHLHRHANKILLRVRLLFYLKHEIIGDLYEQVFAGLPSKEIPIPSPVADGDPPCCWWDEECDKSLLIGVYKHGYDRYNLMRHDPALCFLHRCGPPDGAALLAEMNPDDDLGRTLDEDEEPETPVTPATPSDSNKSDSIRDEMEPTDQSGPLPFPSPADMNQRLRRIITAYQRNFKKQELRLAQQARHQQRLEKLERFEAAIKERELKKREQAQKKWSRREEADFYRVVSSFGVEYNKKEDRFDWSRFRSFSRLERKLDETLTEYFKAFYAMCKRVTGRRLTDEEENLPISVDPISEERASRSLARIDLLSKIREDILTHPELDERLQLCQSSIDLPEWWVCGSHDKDLLIGAAKYGLNRLDFHLMHDPDLSFKDVLGNEEIEASKKENLSEILNKEVEDRKEEVTEESTNNNSGEAVEEKMKVDVDITEVLGKTETKETEKDILNTENDDEGREEQKSDQQTNEKADVSDIKINEVVEDTINDNPGNSDGVISSITDEMKLDKNDETSKETSVEEDKVENLEDSHKSETKESKVEDEQNTEKNTEIKREEEKELENEPEYEVKEEKPEFEAVVSENKTPSDSEKVETKDVSPNELKGECGNEDPQNTSGTQTQSRSAIRWPKDRVLQMRLEQICYCVEKNEWHSFRQAFFSSLTGTVPSTPSIATADSSPRAASPGSLSSISREPTPHPTPDHTPRRESLSPLPEYLFSESGGSMNDSASRRRRRRRKRFEAEVERAKLRNLLSQTIEQSVKKPPIPSLSASSLLNPSFLPPLFSLPFCNLRTDLRNELLSDEKAASLLLSGTLHQPPTKTATNSSGAPPPAHQNSSSRRNNPIDNSMDFRFKTTPALVPPPSPAHKPTPVVTRNDKKNKSPSSPISVLDLSSGQATKRESMVSDTSNKNISGLNSKKSGKKIGSRIDALALNLQAKKMMEEKQCDKQEGFADSKTSDQNRSKEPNKMDFSKFTRQNKNNFPTPPAAHSSSVSTSFSKVNDNQNFSKTQCASGHLSALDASKLPPAKASEASSILEQAAAIRQDLKKWLEDHPEFVAANPNLAAAAAAAMSFTPMTSISANTELLELPEGRRRGRRPKLDPTMLDVQHLTGDENVSVVNRLTGKKITGSKAPPLKHLAEWLEKNPMFDVDPKWSPLIKEKVPSFKTPTSMSSSSIRTRTSDRRISDMNVGNTNSSTNVTSSNSSSRRTTAASLLAQSQSGAHSNQAISTSGSSSSSNTASFGFQPSALNPLGFNPSLLTGFPTMKMFMDSANMCTTTSSSTTSSTSKSHASSAATTSTATSTAISSSSSSSASSAPPMFFPFGGLAGMGLGNPLFGFPGFNLPGLAPGSNPLSDFSSKKEKETNNSGEKSKSNEKSGGSSKSKNSNPGGVFGPSSSSGLGSGGLPFLYPTPNFLYNPLSLGGFSLPSSPFATLAAQSGLMNGLGSLGTTAMSGFTTTTTTSSSSQSKSKNSSISAHKSSSSAKNTGSNSSASVSASGLPFSTTSGVLSSSVHSSKAATFTESDDDSLKSLMGHEDEEDLELNGDVDETETKNDTDSEFEHRVMSRKKSRASKDLKSKKCNATAATSKVTS